MISSILFLLYKGTNAIYFVLKKKSSEEQGDNVKIIITLLEWERVWTLDGGRGGNGLDLEGYLPPTRFHVTV
jgi:hypothetical protein